MPDGAAFRIEAARAGAKVRAMARTLGRRGLALLGAGIVLVLVAIWGVNWFVSGRYQVSTENAYVRADISLVSAKIEGYVRAVPARENQSVHAGDILAEIDPSDYQAQVAAAQGALAQAQGALSSQIAERQWAAANVERYRPLAQRGLLSPAGMQQYEIQARQAGGGQAAAQAAVAAAQAQLAAAQLNLERTVIRAPIDGVVGDRQAQVGQLVRPGTPLMSVVPLQSVYVVANFKETQIAHLHPGQPVIVRADIEHNVRFRGVVDSLAPASGTEFSIIPTDTATGNFTKIVQRVPVRIRILPNQPGAQLLRPGLSVTTTVDTRQ
jgi:membrane fusion protein (multidrug efflux system)